MSENKENMVLNYPHTPEQTKEKPKPSLALTPQTHKTVDISSPSQNHYNSEIEKYKDEIKNLKTALSLLQRAEPKEVSN